MKKGMTQQVQWLNIVIIIISALVLAFTILGRFMNVETGKPVSPTLSTKSNTVVYTSSDTPKTKYHLNRIDFGSHNLFLTAKKNDTESVYQWLLDPPSSLSGEKVSHYITRWQSILQLKPIDEAPKNMSFKPKSTILLYFLKVPQPIIAKVGLEDLSQSSDSSRLPSILITFASSQQQVLLENIDLNSVIPI